MPLSSKYLEQLRKGENSPNTVLEVTLDTGMKRWGFSQKDLEGDGVQAILSSVSSLQNRLDARTGLPTRGEITAVITGRGIFGDFIKNDRLLNRRVKRLDGFTTSGFALTDYNTAYTGKIKDWKREGNSVKVSIQDDLTDAKKKLPVENESKTQVLDYRDMNPVDVMTNIILTQLGVPSAYVDSAKFTSKRDTWLNGWKFSRVLTDPREASELLNELQRETNSFIIHDGNKITFEVFAPPVPGQTVEEWTDMVMGDMAVESGYRDRFYNRVAVHLDYDESGSDGDNNFETAVIAEDSASKTEWGETREMAIKSKWMRSFNFAMPVNITGMKLYHASKNNGAGSGTLTYNSANKTVQWTPPGGAIGEAVNVTKDGRYQISGSDKTKYVRAVVTYASLPGANQTDSISITAHTGVSHATALAQKYLNRFRDPAVSVSVDVGVNDAVYNSEFIKPTDLKDVTTVQASEYGLSSWNKERMMVTSVRPEGSRVKVELVETKMYRSYGFIAAAGFPDYPSATADQKQRAFIGDANNKVGGGTLDGYYIW